MAVKVCLAIGAAVLALGLSAAGAIKAMSLSELMSITTDVVHGTIVSKDSFEMDRPHEGAIWTKLVIEGRSLRTGETGTFEAVFHGSHFERDWYTISEMPTLQDTRVGGETVLFFDRSEWHHGKNVVFDMSGLYRVERGFGEPVVIGKGPGAAFEQNTKLADVELRVAAVHAELAKSGSKPPVQPASGK